MLQRVYEKGSENRDLYRDTRAQQYLFESSEQAGWYVELSSKAWVYYHAETTQYQLHDSNWWDPVTNRVLAKTGDTYRASDGSGDYEYVDDEDRYLLCYVAPTGPAIDRAAATTWLTAHFADTRQRALTLIGSAKAVDKSSAWELFDNWHAAHPQDWIRYEEVGLSPVNRAQDVAVQHHQPAPVATVTRNPSRSYGLRQKPVAGTAIALPTDTEVSANVDFYWQGKGDEAGGGAADRKQEKHGSDPVQAYGFARANSRRWFVQAGLTNHVIFHDFDPSGRGQVVHMAVWNWTSGQMVTFYDINQTVPGGVEAYLQDKGMP